MDYYAAVLSEKTGGFRQEQSIRYGTTPDIDDARFFLFGGGGGGNGIHLVKYPIHLTVWYCSVALRG
jgi:hypothetical protein